MRRFGLAVVILAFVLDPDGKDHTVRGYVPCSARGYWVEAVDHEGDVHSQHGWGYVDKFWRD